MAYVLAFLGLVSFLLGGLGIYTEFTRLGSVTSLGLYQAIGVFVAGAFMLAGAEALVRLAEIARNSKTMGQDIARLAERSNDP